MKHAGKRNQIDRKTGPVTYIAIVVVAVIALFLANPAWLPFSAAVRASIAETEQNYILLKSDANATIAQLVTLALAVCIVWLAYQIIKLILNFLGNRGKRVLTVTDLMIGLLKYASVIVAIVWGLSILGVNATAVVAGIGIIGLIVGFGAQSLIEDIITGAFIIFENQYGLGDIIILDDFRGVVRSIGVRTTVIEDVGGNLKVVNNSDIRNFQNRSKKNSVALVICSVAYETDLPALEKLLAAELPPMLEAHRDLYLTAPRYLGVEELGESGVDLKFAVDCREENIFNARRALARDIRVLFADKGVEIPFPQVVVHQGE